ncbi:hypothetical protein BCR44DRAFT_165195 [Catenaria anguillulae PL171]|uniref:Uncharacterized protein n=1 Tax=Catenaria anguillulae PL171 TaxID=765915 RepID=A0A1Y2HJI9_9FUNG|nr:hypothetical protein BCR44DRAFT_165195 [Catenaria anguillulae PL171]
MPTTSRQVNLPVTLLPIDIGPVLVLPELSVPTKLGKPQKHAKCCPPAPAGSRPRLSSAPPNGATLIVARFFDKWRTFMEVGPKRQELVFLVVRYMRFKASLGVNTVSTVVASVEATITSMGPSCIGARHVGLFRPAAARTNPARPTTSAGLQSTSVSSNDLRAMSADDFLRRTRAALPIVLPLGPHGKSFQPAGARTRAR